MYILQSQFAQVTHRFRYHMGALKVLLLRHLQKALEIVA
jgi:hypothetical protein